MRSEAMRQWQVSLAGLFVLVTIAAVVFGFGRLATEQLVTFDAGTIQLLGWLVGMAVIFAVTAWLYLNR